MHELPTMASKDMIPYAKLNRIIWYFSGISVSVSSAALVVSFNFSVAAGDGDDDDDTIIAGTKVVVESLSEYKGLIVAVNNENVIKSI